VVIIIERNKQTIEGSVDITQLLAFSVKNKASDLHLSAGLPPMIRVHGDVRRINVEPLDHKQVHSHGVRHHERHPAQASTKSSWSVDFSFEMKGLARFRVNAFNQNRGAGAVFRTIPSKILTLEQLNAPKIFGDLALKPRGMVLVTGPTGLGQVHHAGGHGQLPQRNRVRPHPDGGRPDRVRARIQKVPDQPARGRAHDAELCRRAQVGAARRPGRHPGGRNARPGNHPPGHDRGRNRPPGVWHLHTSSAAKTIDRIIDVFPAEEKEMVRAMLSESLQAVISQTLCKTKDGQGRVAAHEIMLGTSAIRNLIREAKVAQMYSAIQTGNSVGMQTLDQNLTDLVRRNIISPPKRAARPRFPKTSG
jgi:twitching motility protein PilT